MSRPSGRYFASVIAKIQEYKNQENIVIDQNFKDQLKANIIAKIQNLPVQSVVKEEAKVEGAAVMMASPEQVSSLENTVQSPSIDEVFFDAPVLPEDQKPAASILDKEIDLNPAYYEVGSEDGFLDKLLKWKYQLAAIPALLLLVMVVVAVKNLPLDLTKKGVDSTQSQNVQMPDSQAASQSEIMTQPNTQAADQKDSQISSQGSQSGMQSGTQDRPVQNKASSDVKTIPSVAQPLSQLVKLTPPASQENPTNTAAGNTQATQPVQTPTPSQVTTTPTVSEPTNTSSKAAVTVQPPISNAVNFKVYYKNNYVEAEKAAFEQKVLTPLLTDKTFAYVIVRDGGSGKVMVDVYKKDGTFTRYNYVYNATLKVWTAGGGSQTTTTQTQTVTQQAVTQQVIQYQIIQQPSFDYFTQPIINYTRVNP